MRRKSRVRESEKVDTLTRPGNRTFGEYPLSHVEKTNSWLKTDPNDSTRSRTVACFLAKLRLAHPPENAAFRSDTSREPSARAQCGTQGLSGRPAAFINDGTVPILTFFAIAFQKGPAVSGEIIGFHCLLLEQYVQAS